MGQLDDDVLKEFLIESTEGLDRLDRDLVALEQNPTSTELIKSIFRIIHTIKGTCGFLGMKQLERVSHVGENLLADLRDGHLTFTPAIATGLLSLCDAIRQFLTNIENTGTEGTQDCTALIRNLSELQSDEGRNKRLANASKAASIRAVIDSQLAARAASEQAPEARAVAPALPETPPTPPAEPVLPPPSLETPPPKLGEVMLQQGLIDPQALADALKQQKAGDPRFLGEILVSQGAVKPAAIVEGLQAQAEAKAAASESSIRVDVALLDKLMNLVGELVLARNQVLQFISLHNVGTFAATSQRLNIITTELQEGVMKTRMQPIGNIWGKFPRIVRDLAAATGKQVRIEMDGKETELDKTIIEAIKDPLTHIVRNTIDHGIETPERRAAAGKPTEGVLLLRAFHEGGQVNIEISDDGAGMDPEKIRKKALERNIITEAQAARMSDRETVNLVFLPGFSTAEKVTNISGRGVGMDVVKTNVEKIGGTVDIQSRVGQGTTLKIKIPLTLAIIPALVVTCAGDRYAIPQVSLVELVRLEGDQASCGVELIHGAPVYRLRGNLLPLVYLDRVLNTDALAQSDAPLAKVSDDVLNIVVLQADGQPFGLVVDDVNDTEEIVVKPVGNHIKGISAFAGATIMGDGRVALILDVVGLAQHARVVSETHDRATVEAGATEGAKEQQSHRQSLLLFAVGKSGRVAMPLSSVARLEEIPKKSVERTGDLEVVQYRGTIMPLLRLTRFLAGVDQEQDAESSPNISVVVYSDGKRSVGLVVDRILDIVEETLAVQSRTQEGCVYGTAVIHRHVTDLLDVGAVLKAANIDLSEDAVFMEARA